MKTHDPQNERIKRAYFTWLREAQGYSDPVKIGLVASFNRPGGNLTGVILYTGALAAKRIELLREFVPGATVLGMLVNPDGPDSDVQVRDAQEAVRISRIELHIVNVRTEKDFETAFAALMEARVAALIVSSDPVFANRREQVVSLAARHAVPAIYEAREFTASGGLVRRQSGDRNDSNRLHNRGRPSAGRPRRQPQPAGR